MPNTVQPTKVVTITPRMAAAWIKRQELLVSSDPLMRNRNIKEDRVRMYAQDMREGNWQLNGESIIFTSNDRLLDGQHRLLACIQANTAFRTHIVYNVPHEAIKTINTGSIRTMGDQLIISNRPNSIVLAVALSVISRWEKANKQGFDWRHNPSRQELFDILERYPELEANIVKTHKVNILMSQGLATALLYIFSQENHDLATQFFESLSTGLNLTEGSPVALLRDRLIRERQLQLASRTAKKLSMSVTAELATRAWLAYKRGVKITKLQVSAKNVNKNILNRRKNYHLKSE